MKIGLRAGHSPNCLGAIGLRNEHYAMRDLFSYVKDAFEKYGHTVVDCNSDAYSEGDELWEGASTANNNGVDLFISLHMNSYNGNAYGTEAWTYGEISRANSYAENLVNNFERLGFYNRGVKYNSRFSEMQNVNAPNVIFETCFCDSSNDIEIWSGTSWEELAYAFCNAIDSNIPFTPPIPVEPPAEAETYFRVVVGSYKERENAVMEMEEAKAKGFTDAFLVAFKK